MFVFLLAVLTLPACQRVGSLEPDSSVPPAPRRSDVALPWPSGQRSIVGPTGPAALAIIDVVGIDEILHSPVSADPILQTAVGIWLTEWTTGEAEVFERYLAQMSSYDLVVGRELDARALPASLRYLPLVESGYSPRAVSRAGATGLWQLMGPTARGLGLVVNSVVDDRRDPEASTSAALDYLEGLHDEFGSWLLALSAYNGGPGRLRRVLRRYGSGMARTGDEQFLEIRRHLPAETRQFVPRFLAAARLAGDPGAYGLVVRGRPPLAYDEVQVPDATSLNVVATVARVSEESVHRLNPQYSRGYTPVGESRTLRVPLGSGVTFERFFPSIAPGDRLDLVEHVVAEGETFTHIARRYGVAVSELEDTNRHVEPRRLQIGMRVVVPLGSASLETDFGVGGG